MGYRSSRSSTETSASIWQRSKPTRAVWWSSVTRCEGVVGSHGTLPNNSMASNVKRKKIPVEALESLLKRDSGNKGYRASVVCVAAVSHDGVSHQAAPNNSWGSASPDRLPRPADGGHLAPRPRYSCVPRAGPSKRRDRAGRRSPFGVSSARGQPRGLIPPVPLLPNTGVVPGANQNNEVGSGDAARRPGSRRAHFSSPWRRVRPWLPPFGRAAPRHARLLA
jgi:hypothetical protein